MNDLVNTAADGTDNAAGKTPANGEVLLPCPFCGGTDTQVHKSAGDVPKWSIAHQSEYSDCMSREWRGYFRSEQAVVNAWNNRPLSGLSETGESDLRKAFRLGFEASAEGYNAEYPFEGEDVLRNDRWIELRDKTLSEHFPPSPKSEGTEPSVPAQPAVSAQKSPRERELEEALKNALWVLDNAHTAMVTSGISLPTINDPRPAIRSALRSTGNG